MHNRIRDLELLLLPARMNYLRMLSENSDTCLPKPKFPIFLGRSQPFQQSQNWLYNLLSYTSVTATNEEQLHGGPKGRGKNQRFLQDKLISAGPLD